MAVNATKMPAQAAPERADLAVVVVAVVALAAVAVAPVAAAVAGVVFPADPSRGSQGRSHLDRPQLKRKALCELGRCAGARL